MILAYVSGVLEGTDRPDLCIVADKPSPFSTPVRIASLLETNCGIHLLSIEEGITVEIDPDTGAKIITPLSPANLYLNPNRPERPGFSVGKVKILPFEGQSYRVWFDREERGWTEWQPNKRIY